MEHLRGPMCVLAICNTEPKYTSGTNSPVMKVIFERLDIILKQSDGNRRDFSEESSEIAKFFIVGRPARLSGSRLPPGHRDKREGKRQWVTNSGGQSGWGGWVRR